MRRGAINFIVNAALACATAAFAQTTQPNDIDARMRAVLVAMKSPAATGVLITELGPGSLAGEAGAREGDIVTEYHGQRIKTLAELRDAVAEVIAAKELRTGVGDKVLMGVRRGDKDEVLQVAKGALGFRGINAESGVRLEPNPVATPREKVALAWEKIPERPAETWLRVMADRGLNAVERVELVGFEKGMFQVSHVVWPAEGGAGLVHAVNFRVEAGGPAFFLEQARVTGGEHELIVRRGQTLLAGDKKFATRTDVVPAALLPLVASALPQEAEVVVPLSVLRTEDVKTCAGYVLVTRGEKELPESKDKAWQVDLLLFGSVVERYWISGGREVVRVDVLPGIVKLRAADKKAALVGMKNAPDHEEK